ncbi:MAG: diadenylate cyclase [Desulfobacteraceae bacterium]|nr:MAG: diadenylate cyclase [Desulfobacteraceae bacterium]
MSIISDIRFKDVLDILFLSIFAYHLYLWFYGTKAFKALVGLLALGAIYTAAQLWHLFLTTWMFQIFWQVLIILLIILFQSEIRQVLERMNPFRAIGWKKLSNSPEWIEKLSRACFLLAKRQCGALIILERMDRVDELITGGTNLEGETNSEVLMSIFQKGSPLHDGAVLIRDGKVIRVAAYLPLSSAEGLPPAWGTRHRAAVGLSERCDAWVVAVSEERSEVSLARSGQVKRLDDENAMTALLAESLHAVAGNQKSLFDRSRSFVINRWPVKLGALALVSILWLAFAGQQDFEVTLQVPVQIKNLPEKIEIIQPRNPRVSITVRGLRKDASTVQPGEVDARLDLALAGYGWKRFRISRDQIILPNQQVDIVRIDPTEFSFEFKQKDGRQ